MIRNYEIKPFKIILEFSLYFSFLVKGYNLKLKY